MGYYICIKAKNRRWADEMLEFMRLNYRDTRQVCPLAPPEDSGLFMGRPQPGENVCSYSESRREIGWYQNAAWSTEDRYYARALLRWMALKVGEAAKLIGQDVFVEGRTGYVPARCWLYDGDPQWFVTAKAMGIEEPTPETRDRNGCLVTDSLGWVPAISGPFEEVSTDPEMNEYLRDIWSRNESAQTFVREEVRRLDNLWARRKQK